MAQTRRAPRSTALILALALVALFALDAVLAREAVGYVERILGEANLGGQR